MDGDKSVPWKVIPDPSSPVTPWRKGKKYCFIVVDQFCDAYTNANASVAECVKNKLHGKPKTGPHGNCSWNDMGGVNDGKPTIPRFCDPMEGGNTKSTGTKGNETNYQCYGVLIHGATGEEGQIPVLLEPCPFTIEYTGQNGPVRRSGDKKHQVNWG